MGSEMCIRDSYNGSDHNTIEFNLIIERIKIDPIHQFHKADWEIFHEELDKHEIKIPPVMTERRLEKCLDSYYTTINKSLDKACPKKAPKTKDKNNPWWTKQLTEHRRIVNRLYK